MNTGRRGTVNAQMAEWNGNGSNELGLNTQVDPVIAVHARRAKTSGWNMFSVDKA